MKYLSNDHADTPIPFQVNSVRFLSKWIWFITSLTTTWRYVVQVHLLMAKGESSNFFHYNWTRKYWKFPVVVTWMNTLISSFWYLVSYHIKLFFHRNNSTLFLDSIICPQHKCKTATNRVVWPKREGNCYQEMSWSKRWKSNFLTLETKR